VALLIRYYALISYYVYFVICDLTSALKLQKYRLQNN